jgi:hypothetical protein
MNIYTRSFKLPLSPKEGVSGSPLARECPECGTDFAPFIVRQILCGKCLDAQASEGEQDYGAGQ